MIHFVFLIFAVMLGSALAQSGSCAKNLFVEFVQGPSCDSLTILTLRLDADTCYNSSYNCGTAVDPAVCDQKTWDECMQLSGCDATGSFRIHNGTLFSYPYNLGCEGIEFQTTGCLFSIITMGGYRQLDARVALNDSICY